MTDRKMDGKPALVLFHMQRSLAGEQDFIHNWGGDAAVAMRESGMLDRIQSSRRLPGQEAKYVETKVGE